MKRINLLGHGVNFCGLMVDYYKMVILCHFQLIVSSHSFMQVDVAVAKGGCWSSVRGCGSCEVVMGKRVRSRRRPTGRCHVSMLRTMEGSF